MNLYNKNIQSYLEQHTDARSSILDELHRRTYVERLMPQMISGLVQGNFLSMICKLASANKILEIGTFTGYGTICLANAIDENGHVTTLEKNKEFTDIAQRFWDKAEVSHKITQHIGDAAQIIPTLNETWDMVFIDAAKKHYVAYFNLIFPSLKKGGLIIADNVLWSGKVITEPNDSISQKLDAFNKFVTEDTRVENVILPLRDGVHLIRKK